MKVVNPSMITTTLYNVIRSELIKEGFNEFVDDEGNLVLFNEESQFMTKILSYDEDIKNIINKLFTGVSLTNRQNDEHFKKTFLYRFLNRQINFQTVESFRVSLLSTFLMNQQYMNTVYDELDQYITQKQLNENTNNQTNKQLSDGSTTTDNRQAYAQLPQNNVQLDVNSTVMDSANDNTISRNKQINQQENTGETTGESLSENKTYQLNELLKSSQVMENIFNEFDRKCFLQIW